MGIRMVRQPSAVYTAKQNSNYYAEDDVNLTTSLGVLNADTNAYLVNLVYGKVILNNIEYLVSIKDMKMESDMKNYNSVSNIDDIIPFRYAYGDQNGYVIGKGTEISHTIDGNTFRINSGRVVLQGVETDIDANGVSFTIDNASESRYFVVYYEVNLATQTTAIKLSTYSTSGYPTIDAGDDLTTNPSGIARMELYRFIATGGVIDSRIVQRTAKGISYYNGQLITDFKDYGGYLDIAEDEYEVATASSGDVLKFNISAPNGLVINVFSTTDVIRVRITDGLNLWKRLSTCSESEDSTSDIKQIERYVNIKYNNGKVYIKGFKYNKETKLESHSDCYLTSIYKVSEV